MNPPKTKKKPKPATAPVIEIEAGAWERFEKLVKSAAKMGHQAHAPAKPKPRSK